MPKSYTGSGDQGSTSIIGGSRVPKDHPRIIAVGAIDEATEALGFARAITEDPELKEIVLTIQTDLYQIMAQLAQETPDPEKIPDLEKTRTDWLEEMITKFEEDITQPEGFIIPGNSALSAAYGMARTIVRRAEREVVHLNTLGLLNSKLSLAYLNRLSSLCFVLELYTSENHFSQPTK